MKANDNRKTERAVGVRLDPVTAEKLDYLCAEFKVNTSTMLRWLVNYIDDHRAPCGRLSAFRAHRQRIEALERKHGL